MANEPTLGYFLEDLWTRGFRLSDEDIRFIYFGKTYTNSEDWLVIIAVKVSLQFQVQFDGSFFLSLLEFLQEEQVNSKREAWRALEKKGFNNRKKLRK